MSELNNVDEAVQTLLKEVVPMTEKLAEIFNGDDEDQKLKLSLIMSLPFILLEKVVGDVDISEAIDEVFIGSLDQGLILLKAIEEGTLPDLSLDMIKEG